MIAKYVVEHKESMGGFGRLWIFSAAYSTKSEANAAQKRIAAYRKVPMSEVRVITMAAYKKSTKQK